MCPSDLDDFISDYKYETGNLPTMDYVNIEYPHCHLQIEFILKFNPLGFNEQEATVRTEKIKRTIVKNKSLRLRHLRRKMRAKRARIIKMNMFSIAAYQKIMGLNQVECIVGYLSVSLAASYFES